MVLEKYKYKILPEKRLIIRYYQGLFSLNDLIAFLNETGKDALYDPTFNVINDFRNAESTVKIGEINTLFGYVKGSKKIYGKRKSAFITRTPNQTVFSMMMGLLKYENEVKFKTFSTLIEAIKWLGLASSDLIEIEYWLNDFTKAT
jgi:hypothetical protein